MPANTRNAANADVAVLAELAEAVALPAPLALVAEAVGLPAPIAVVANDANCALPAADVQENLHGTYYSNLVKLSPYTPDNINGWLEIVQLDINLYKNLADSVKRRLLTQALPVAVRKSLHATFPIPEGHEETFAELKATIRKHLIPPEEERISDIIQNETRGNRSCRAYLKHLCHKAETTSSNPFIKAKVMASIPMHVKHILSATRNENVEALCDLADRIMKTPGNGDDQQLNYMRQQLYYMPQPVPQPEWHTEHRQKDQNYCSEPKWPPVQSAEHQGPGKDTQQVNYVPQHMSQQERNTEYRYKDQNYGSEPRLPPLQNTENQGQGKDFRHEASLDIMRAIDLRTRTTEEQVNNILSGIQKKTLDSSNTTAEFEVLKSSVAKLQKSFDDWKGVFDDRKAALDATAKSMRVAANGLANAQHQTANVQQQMMSFMASQKQHQNSYHGGNFGNSDQQRRGRSQSFGRDNSRKYGDLCQYHGKFGDNAYKCEHPCSRSHEPRTAPPVQAPRNPQNVNYYHQNSPSTYTNQGMQNSNYSGPGN